MRATHAAETGRSVALGVPVASVLQQSPEGCARAPPQCALTTNLEPPMQLTTIPGAQYDRVGTQRLLNDLAVDLSRHDAQLESMVRSGNTVGGGWGEWFDRTSHTLLAGRDAYVALNPQDAELASRLGVELIDFTQNGGRIASAQDRNTSLSHGWASALDSTISVVQEAANRLYGTGPTPPITPPVPPHPGGTRPPQPGGSDVVRDAGRAAQLVRRSLETIRSLPTDDTGTSSTKDARIAAYNLNMDAQKLIEPHFNSGDEFVTSQLRTADAHLEDANWQLAKKPSPDGRFNGVDIPGAQRDADRAVQILEKFATALATAA